MVFIMYSILFATCAAVLVTSYATHAKHSGIPEIKTILGGFVIKKFMGLWTLMIKSVGLVGSPIFISLILELTLF